MKKIISFEFNEGNLYIRNPNSISKEMIVSFDKKNLSANDVYQIFSYAEDDNFDLNYATIEMMEDSPEKDFCQEVINIFKSIISQLELEMDDNKNLTSRIIEDPFNNNQNTITDDFLD